MNELAVARVLREEHAQCKTLFAIFRGQCEGCDKPARHSDSEGVPLCCECDAELTAEAIAEFDAEMARVPSSFWEKVRLVAHGTTPPPSSGSPR